MMHIYIHLPFCLSRCIYCDFSVALKGTPERRQVYLDALLTEIRHYLAPVSDTLPPIATLYFGGGTPGLFTADELKQIMTTFTTFTTVAPDAEITMEANPEGMASDPEDYLNMGINRLSIGVQSFQQNELKRLSRIHSVNKAKAFIQHVRDAGFSNIALDLMYGIPEQTAQSWQNTLEHIITMAPEHISMYGLQQEKGTKLDQLIKQGRMAIPDGDQSADMYAQGIGFLQANGYEHYEISNLAKPGYASQHNLSYWDNAPCWGFGVSAHGYINHVRTENHPDLTQYLANPTQHINEHPCSVQEQLENALIFGLRKRSGVHIPTIETRYNIDFNACYKSVLTRYIEADLLQWNNDTLTLTEQGIPVSNTILAEFIGGIPTA